MENRKRKRKYWILLIILLSYLVMGLFFTVLRSNAYYNYFIVNEDSLEKNGNSYWENRCIAENKNNPIPNAQWCVDGFGSFNVEKPNRFYWYISLYIKRPFDFLVTLMLWWTQFLGNDLINFRSVRYGY